MIAGSVGRTQISPTVPGGNGRSSSSMIATSASPRALPAEEPFSAGSSGRNTVTGNVSVCA